jgi:hypothetical protein
MQPNSERLPMTPIARLALLIALGLVLMLLLPACSAVSPNLPPVVIESREVPELPQAARQPPTPALCSQSCQDGLTKRRENWLQSLMPAGSPGRPASGLTTH